MIASADIHVRPPNRIVHLLVWVPDGPYQKARMLTVMRITALLHAKGSTWA